MNIQLLTSNFINNRNNTAMYSSQNYLNNMTYTNLKPLTKDTVSFTGSKTLGTIGQSLANQYEKVEKPALKIAGNKFKAALGEISRRLEAFGVHFDYDYNENTVKSLKSYMSKWLRSGANPKDKLRATLFVDNPYDLKLFANQILPAIREFGYEIVGLGEKYKNSKMPADFDIRLDGIKPKHTEVLEEPLRNLISGPQKSGYEDIQMRLYDTSVAKSKQVPHELLIVFGKETAKAKHHESYYVYDITRELGNMHIIQEYATKDGNNNVKRAKAAFNIIRSQLNSNISIPLFSNAKNKDYYNSNIEAPVKLSFETCQILYNALETLSKDINIFYKKEIQKVKSRDFDSTIEKIVKATYEYKKRDTKQIFAADIIEKRRSMIKTLKDEQKDDREVIKFVRERLAETIEKYGEKQKTKS